MDWIRSEEKAELREERIRWLRRSIESGTYDVPASLIAKALMETSDWYSSAWYPARSGSALPN